MLGKAWATRITRNRPFGHHRQWKSRISQESFTSSKLPRPFITQLDSINNNHKYRPYLAITNAIQSIESDKISPSNYQRATHTTNAKMLSRSVRAASAGRLLAATLRPAVVPTFRQLAPAVTVAPRRSYHEKVLDHYSRPRNVGTLDKTDSSVGEGLVGAPACGDVMRLHIKVDPNTNVISDVKFKTFGCGSAIASSSYLTELVRGMTLDQASKVKNTEIAKELCLPPVKLHCSMLAEDAIKSAINNYYTKNPQAKTTNLGGTEAKLEAVAA
ncbi:NifU-like N terminal domain-containing protein [Podospora didyma]|uniref:Iron-sulfur cluster assembly protein n=1 Tax=Podospora didyma TaxID=330526 RepID=A0AAE0NGC9_9PEZI|nr:NifU-like N terminal domain-containing protein [Podospora didyma]